MHIYIYLCVKKDFLEERINEMLVCYSIASAMRLERIRHEFTMHAGPKLRNSPWMLIGELMILCSGDHHLTNFCTPSKKSSM